MTWQELKNHIETMDKEQLACDACILDEETEQLHPIIDMLFIDSSPFWSYLIMNSVIVEPHYY